MKMDRPAFKITATNPGSDVAAEYAAAMAVGSMVFKEKGRYLIRSDKIYIHICHICSAMFLLQIVVRYSFTYYLFYIKDTKNYFI